MEKQIVDLGEYKIVIEHNNDGSGELVVTILDELDGEIERIDISND